MGTAAERFHGKFSFTISYFSITSLIGDPTDLLQIHEASYRFFYFHFFFFQLYGVVHPHYANKTDVYPFYSVHEYFPLWIITKLKLFKLLESAVKESPWSVHSLFKLNEIVIVSIWN